jgi:hypothetical protein
VRIPAVVVNVAVSERNDGEVLDGVRLAGDLEEAMELLQLG